jgi:3-phosphoshikimate 1-carboxyvinyltransferase
VRVTIERSEIDGRIEAPSSKSITHRAVICSALAQGRSRVNHPLVSDDTEATLKVVKAIGAGVERSKRSWIIEGGEFNPPKEALDCGDSGTTLRLMRAVCALVEGTSILKGGVSLSNRPVEPLIDALKQVGVPCESKGGNPPVKVHGKGGIDGGEVSIRGDISSQFVSALLLVAPYARNQLRVKVTTRLESAPYVGMTMDAQRAFGIQVEASEGYREILVENQAYTPTEYGVEGDWSSGAYILAAGALAGRASVENLLRDSKQADAAIVDVLGEMGVKPKFHGERVDIDRAENKGIDWDLTDSPDLFPVVAALCSAANGDSRLRGLRRLRLKESDRIASMVEGLNRMGIKNEPSADSIIIHGGVPEGSVIDPHGDHRIAMAFGVLGLAAIGETAIKDAECVSKSYPGFWEDLESLSARVGRKNDG